MAKAWPVGNLDPGDTLEQNARLILAVRVAEFYSYAPVVHDQRAGKELHEMRISAKRLRYTLELFRVVYAERGEECIDRVKELQEELGTFHDHDVRIALIEAELAELAVSKSAELSELLAAAPSGSIKAITAAALRPPPDDPRSGLLALLGRQYKSRRATRDRFEKLWDELGKEGLRSDLVRLTIPDDEHQPAESAVPLDETDIVEAVPGPTE